MKIKPRKLKCYWLEWLDSFGEWYRSPYAFFRSLRDARRYAVKIGKEGSEIRIIKQDTTERVVK